MVTSKRVIQKYFLPFKFYSSISSTTWNGLKVNLKSNSFYIFQSYLLFCLCSLKNVLEVCLSPGILSEHISSICRVHQKHKTKNLRNNLNIFGRFSRFCSDSWLGHLLSFPCLCLSIYLTAFIFSPM